MKQSKYSTLWKAVAFILTVMMGVLCLSSVLGAAILSTDGYYADPAQGYIKSSLFRYTESPYNRSAYLQYWYGKQNPSDAGDYDDLRLNPALTNYRYAIFDENRAFLCGTSGEISFDRAMRSGTSTKNASGNETVYVIGMLDPALRVDDVFARQSALLETVVSARFLMLGSALFSFLFAVALLVYLCCAAGHASSDAEICCRGLDRIPSDVYFALEIGLIALVGWGVYSVSHLLWASDAMFPTFAVLLLALIVIGTLLVAGAMSFSARVKTRTFLHNSVTGFLCRALWRFVKWVCRGVRSFFQNLPILWKTIAVVGGYLTANAILIALSNRSAFAALLLVLLNVAAFAFACAVTLQMKRLKADGEALARGDLAHRIATYGYFGEFKAHAASLSGIRDGVSRAVSEQVKSDRMRTDLITNVSHDIKTPLTTIINYVDLLKKQPLPAPCDEYVAALDRASSRLKKLTLDVVEASKASSGALPVSIAPADLNEMLMQCAAEYETRLADTGLNLVSTLPASSPTVLCDGRLSWRVLDNLLSNAAKYALSGTRVYLDVTTDESAAHVSIKNVSRDPLNVSPDELTERFVRGDNSRSDGGSGLGLSIAKSLAELQGGKLSLLIDGDLFKATFTLPLAGK